MGQLKIVCAQLGPIDTNTYILMDDEIKEAIIIDPAGSPEEIIKFLENEGYSLDGVLLTHGHHDHKNFLFRFCSIHTQFPRIIMFS